MTWAATPSPLPWRPPRRPARRPGGEMRMRIVPAKALLPLLASLALGLSCAPTATPTQTPPAAGGVTVNDVHSQLNETRVNRVVSPESVDAIQEIVRQAGAEGRAISIAGGRHAMGAQQSGTDTILLDISRTDKVMRLPAEHA